MASGKKVTLITGCSSGIGLYTAVRLAKDGNYKVYATMRNLAKKGELEKEAGSALNDSLFILALDICKEAQIVEVVQRILQENGNRFDVLINNAAFGHFGLFENMSMSDIRQMIETNMIGTYRLTQEVIPIMKKRQTGHIINISSVGGIIGVPYNAVYGATKFAMEGLTESLYPELRMFNVKINTVCPGAVATSFQQNMSSNKTGTSDMFDKASVDAVSKDVKDPKSAQLMTGFLKLVSENLMPHGQTSEQVADVIADCLTDPEHKVRYGTSDYGWGVIKQTYADGVGATGALGWYEMMKKHQK
ncbi:retinol dehydrogenase 8-like [Diadema antillarum]|uniref:retinol dehydrogenase 8-like n=1 Tax=Diadema antillarum TaxID=105358 RepID=UPI003A885BDE